MVDLAESKKPSAIKKRALKFILSVFLTLGFLYFLFRQIHFSELLQVFTQIAFIYIVAALVALSVDFAFRILRWQIMLKQLGSPICYKATVRPFVASMAFNNVLPFRAGDFLRIFAFKSAHQLEHSSVLGTLVLERLLDMLVLMLIFFVALPKTSMTIHLPEHLLLVIKVLTFIGVIMLLGILVFAHFFIVGINKLSAVKSVANSRLLIAILKHCHHFIIALKILRSWRVFLYLVALSLLAWGIEGLLFLSVAQAIGYQGTFLGPYFAFALGTLATLIPSAPGYVGAFDYFTMLGMHAYGLNITMSTAYALMVHILLWLPITVLGFILYLKRVK